MKITVKDYFPTASYDDLVPFKIGYLSSKQGIGKDEYGDDVYITSFFLNEGKGKPAMFAIQVECDESSINIDIDGKPHSYFVKFDANVEDICKSFDYVIDKFDSSKTLTDFVELLIKHLKFDPA